MMEESDSVRDFVLDKLREHGFTAHWPIPLEDEEDNIMYIEVLNINKRPEDLADFIKTYLN